MKYGMGIHPRLELGSDPAALKDYAQTAEGQGYEYVFWTDCVLGAAVLNP